MFMRSGVNDLTPDVYDHCSDAVGMPCPRHSGRELHMRIGDLATRTQVSVRSLRYYEEQGLLGSTRSPSGQRRYDESAIERVAQIQSLYAAGLNSATIAEMLPCLTTPSRRLARPMAKRLRAERERIDQQLRQLEAVRGSIDVVLAKVAAPRARAS